ncbi:V-type ATP synthase subunit D [Massiliimalia massiliensis]|uniref:V-type ATP synthase subunit D n=1 Tax=Massiliimalia massiliensis TaxID=1852384 RepID=UPI0009851C1C|nr:V-type ATP synthase subunit D [Massiliimalia massiliensis]
MAMPVFPTKGNLINTKKSLSLAKLGFDLMDRKRNILIREMVSLVDKAKSIRGEIESTYAQAYKALQSANITMGVIDNIANGIDVETGVHITYRSVMGVEIPKVSLQSTLSAKAYGFMDTNSQFDLAYASLEKAKELTVVLAEVENSVCRLANEIKKTQRRANALHNIIIPQFEDTIKMISESLEEKEREEFSRLKVIKKQKGRAMQ